MIEKYKRHTTLNNYFQTKRNRQSRQWLHHTIHDTLITNFYSKQIVRDEIQRIEKQMELKPVNPYQVVRDLFKKLN
jgi:putative protein kinase ArgK-like GTPase of G3E family